MPACFVSIILTFLETDGTVLILLFLRPIIIHHWEGLVVVYHSLEFITLIRNSKVLILSGCMRRIHGEFHKLFGNTFLLCICFCQRCCEVVIRGDGIIFAEVSVCRFVLAVSCVACNDTALEHNSGIIIQCLLHLQIEDWSIVVSLCITGIFNLQTLVLRIFRILYNSHFSNIAVDILFSFCCLTGCSLVFIALPVVSNIIALEVFYNGLGSVVCRLIVWCRRRCLRCRINLNIDGDFLICTILGVSVNLSTSRFDRSHNTIWRNINNLGILCFPLHSLVTNFCWGIFNIQLTDLLIGCCSCFVVILRSHSKHTFLRRHEFRGLICLFRTLCRIGFFVIGHTGSNLKLADGNLFNWCTNLNLQSCFLFLICLRSDGNLSSLVLLTNCLYIYLAFRLYNLSNFRIA